ncbi:peptidase [Cronobacter dublinensis subsp. dublinensis]|nr:peptidase [Cronobacter dublinensis subsp. dublinensis]EGT5729721.1 peptidase [Cronobacter dublinensis subsp. dublinensis]
MAFQSPAQNYSENRINFGDLIYLSPHSTYIFRSASDYPDTGIMKGSLLAIDRGLTPQHGHIIIAVVNDELVLRRLIMKPSPALQELDAGGRVTRVSIDRELPVWGVVAYSVTDHAGLGFNHVT